MCLKIVSFRYLVDAFLNFVVAFKRFGFLDVGSWMSFFGVVAFFSRFSAMIKDASTYAVDFPSCI